MKGLNWKASMEIGLACFVFVWMRYDVIRFEFGKDASRVLSEQGTHECRPLTKGN